MEKNTTSKRKADFIYDPGKLLVCSSHQCLVSSIYWVITRDFHFDIYSIDFHFDILIFDIYCVIYIPKFNYFKVFFVVSKYKNKI